MDDLQAHAEEYPEGQSMAVRMGHRSLVSVPLLREEEAIGVLTIRRLEVRPPPQNLTPYFRSIHRSLLAEPVAAASSSSRAGRPASRSSGTKRSAVSRPMNSDSS